MSSVGAHTVTAVLDTDTRTLQFYGSAPWSRQAVTINLSGSLPAPSDLVIVAYRKGIMVAGVSAGDFSGTTSAAAGVLETNTVEMAQTLLASQYADVAAVDIQLWNSNVSSLELLGRGSLELKCSGPAYSVATGATPVTPIVGSTGTLGSFGWKSGKIYFRNDTIAGPANWFPVSLQGEAGHMFIDYSQPGEVLV